MIDPAIGWIKIRIVHSARADIVSNILELAWLTRYSLPSKGIVDRGNEFLAEIKILIQLGYGITVKPITSRNSILERVYQTIGNIIRTFKVQDMVLDDENTWDRFLASTQFTLHITVHTS